MQVEPGFNGPCKLYFYIDCINVVVKRLLNFGMPHIVDEDEHFDPHQLFGVMFWST